MKKISEPWQAAYFAHLKLMRDKYNNMPDDRLRFAFADYNQDGVPELIVYAYFEGYSSFQVYTYVNGALQRFTNNGRKDALEFRALPDGYRNRNSNKLKWVYTLSGESYSIGEYLKEVLFDYDNYQIRFKNLFQSSCFRILKNGGGTDIKHWQVNSEDVSQERYAEALREWYGEWDLVIPHDEYGRHILAAEGEEEFEQRFLAAAEKAVVLP